ncbi:MAG: hypothetical protein CL922_01655 [Deltaproteobacteria bacterium]|nr:hypothetical protein [Deltaproteobacteria bacterium]
MTFDLPRGDARGSDGQSGYSEQPGILRTAEIRHLPASIIQPEQNFLNGVLNYGSCSRLKAQ